jgi:hypothetical protein
MRWYLDSKYLNDEGDERILEIVKTCGARNKRSAKESEREGVNKVLYYIDIYINAFAPCDYVRDISKVLEKKAIRESLRLFGQRSRKVIKCFLSKLVREQRDKPLGIAVPFGCSFENVPQVLVDNKYEYRYQFRGHLTE